MKYMTLKKAISCTVLAALAAGIYPSAGVSAAKNDPTILSYTFDDALPEEWSVTSRNEGIESEVEIKDGELHYFSDTVMDGIFNEPGVVWTLNGKSGIKYEDGKKYGLKFKVRKCGDADFHVKIDFPTGDPWDAKNTNGWRGPLDIMKITGEGVFIKNGNSSLTSNYNKIYSGATEGKDIEVFAYLDGLNRKSDFVVKIDNESYTISDCNWKNSPDSWIGFDQSAIKTIGFVSDNREGQIADTTDVYIDDVVFTTLTESSCELLNRISDKFFVSNDSFDVKFGIDVNEDSLKKGVKLIRTDNETAIETDGEYLANEKIFRITPKEKLTDGGKYLICLDNDIISPEQDILKGIIRFFASDMSFQYFADILPVPEVSDAELFGTVAEGEELSLTYKYSQPTGLADESVIKWYYCDTEDGEFAEIPEAEGLLKYTVTSDYADKFIKCIIEAKAGDFVGNTAESDIAAPPTKPVAENVFIKLSHDGEFVTGDVIEGSYDFYDRNKDKEGKTIYRWLRSDKKEGPYEAIENATEKTYKATSVDRFIIFEVTPVSEKETGESYKSEPIEKTVLPVAKNVKIKKDSGNLLTGKYDFYHEYDEVEGDSKYEWIVGAKVVSEGITYKAQAGEKVIFRIYPRCANSKLYGEYAEVEISISSGSSSSKGGSSGSGASSGSIGGGGSYSSIAGGLMDTARDKYQEQIKANEKPEAADMQGHWAEEFAKEMLDKGIMKLDSEKKFDPSHKLTRAEVVEYIFRALGLTQTDYKNEFEDVSKDDAYAGMLQTLVDKGIISHDVKFRPNDNITRQELCKVLSVALDLPRTYIDLSTYADYENIGDWAMEYVQDVIASRLMVGVSAVEFSPRTNVTKAQMAKLVSMILNKKYNSSEQDENKPDEVPSGENQYNRIDTSGVAQSAVDLSGEDVVVGFIGGSLTYQGQGNWITDVIKALKEKLPDKNIIPVYAGVSGTNSKYGVARFKHDILDKNPDMVFIEFAVNDSNFNEYDSKVYMEQMVQQCMAAEKQPAVSFLYCPIPDSDIANDETYLNNIKYKKELAEHYGINSIDINEYVMNEFNTQKEKNPSLSLEDYFAGIGYKKSGSGFDVHGGYGKYSECIINRINSDFDAFLKKPKDVENHCKDNEKKTSYNMILASDSKITYEGKWIKCKKGFNSDDPNASVAEFLISYFDGLVMQNVKGNASFEITTDAEALQLMVVTSGTGAKGEVFIDGVSAGEISNKNVNINYNFGTGWIKLPNDGKEHTVKYVFAEPKEDSYAFNLGAILERR